MKKYMLAVLFLICFTSAAFGAAISVTSYVTPNDVSVTNLEDNQNTIVDAINSADGALLQAGTVTTAALDNNANPEERWGRAFNDWVFTGLLPPTTSGTLTSTTTAGEAFITNASDQQKFVEKDATANTYTASKWTYVDINSAGTYTYVETGISTAEPATTATSIRLCRVSSDPTQVTNVRDDRPLSIQLGTQEDQYRVGFVLTTVSPDALTNDPGVAYNGTTRLEKIADTVLDLATADDWATGVSGRATSTKGYVVINPNGSIKLTTTAPTLTDTDGNTAGELRYSVINAINWRVLNWFWMDGNGSGNTNPQLSGKWTDTYLPGDIVQEVNVMNGSLSTGTTAMVTDDGIPEITEGDEYMTLDIAPTSATNKLEIKVVVNYSDSGTASIVALFQDTTTLALAGSARQLSANWELPATIIYYMTAGTTNFTTFRVRIGSTTGGTITFNGSSAGRLLGGVMASSITIKEIKQ